VWSFLAEIGRQGGLVAVLFSVLVIAFGAAVRALWNTNQSLQREMLAALTTIQEKRVAEAHAINDRVTAVLRETDASNNALCAAMEALTSVLRRGR
jgi:hypothetical protein